jgi:hypothetical protein
VSRSPALCDALDALSRLLADDRLTPVELVTLAAAGAATAISLAAPDEATAVGLAEVVTREIARTAPLLLAQRSGELAS